MGSPQGGFGQTGIGDSPGISSGPSGTAAGASGASVASIALSSYSDILKGEGTEAAYNYKASALENAAARGRVAAAQTGAAESIKITSTLGMIDATRAAAHADPTSPTGAAVRDWNEQLGLTKKAIDVDNIMAQVQQESDDARYLRQAGKQALQMGYLNAATDTAAALAKGG